MPCCCEHKCIHCEVNDVERLFKSRHYISPKLEARLVRIGEEAPPSPSESASDWLERLYRISQI